MPPERERRGREARPRGASRGTNQLPPCERGRCRHGGAVNCSPSTITTVTLSLPPARLALRSARATARLGIARMPLHRSRESPPTAPGRSARRCTAAARYRGSNGIRCTSMKSGSSGACSSEPTSRNTSLRRGWRMASASVSSPTILALAHRRMVVRDLADLAAADLVQPRIAHVADDRRAVLQHREREHAGHPFPFGIGARRRVESRCWPCAMASRMRCSAVPVCRSRRARARAPPRSPPPSRRRPGRRCRPPPGRCRARRRCASASSLLLRTRPGSLAPAHLRPGLNHSARFGTPGRPRPPGRCAPAPARAPRRCGRASRRPRTRCWTAPSRRRWWCPGGSGP